MGKSTHFIGQPLLRQIINFLDKDKVLRLSRKHGGERYVKRFDGWQHLVVMLYAVIMRFDSLREIAIATLAEARKLAHLGVTTMPRRSTLSYANARRPEAFFEDVYRDLYATHRQKLLSDSRGGETPKWMEKLQIIDSTTITLFSNLIFKGAGRNPKSGKKKGGIKVHKVIRALEGVASDIKFTSAATHDSFMLAPKNFERGDLLALDRAYIDYGKFEELTKRGIVYVTKMKSGLAYKVVSDVMFMDQAKGMVMRIQNVTFTKKEKNGAVIVHNARIVTHADDGKKKCVSLLTNDFDMSPEDIIAIYKQRWEIETLFKQIKQNFPLHFFYGESANAIKIQIWVTLIANLLLTIMQRSLRRRWSFSNLATTVRITLMYYVDFLSFFENPEKDWQKVLLEAAEPPPQLELDF
ncbi:MAG: IS4 family transposase [Bacteroidales bacterium]|nr:IS4 family transposase [Bacteroidales bacterium]